MSTLTRAGGLTPRVARKSDDYVEEIRRRRGSDSESTPASQMSNPTLATIRTMTTRSVSG